MRLAHRTEVLAVASGGGHWVELMRLRPAFEGCDVVYASVQDSSRDDVPDHRYYAFPDASRKNKAGFTAVVARMARIIARERPRVIVTTGSAPALMCIAIGRLFGARTLWIDSIANCKQLSMSGRLARTVAHRCVSQWPEVARANGIECWGQIL